MENLNIYDENMKKIGKIEKKDCKRLEKGEYHLVVEDYKLDTNKKQRESYKYIGKKVKVKIDRKIGSSHPKHGFEYKLNYGFVPDTVSGDGEELDCYIMGIEEEIEEFEGICIAVIHRTNDDDDKLVIVPEGEDFSDEEIREKTYFQEQYFESEIIR